MRMPPLPEPPRPASRTPFPVVAVVAPMLGAVVIGVVLASPFMLLFAALGPVVAVASAIDSRRTARRHHGRELERFERDCSLFERAIELAHIEERRQADERFPVVAQVLAAGQSGDGVRVGRAPARCDLAPDVMRPLGDTEADERLSRMLARAQRNPELPALVARGPIVLTGRGLVADGLARRLGREPGVTLYRRGAEDDTSAVTAPPSDATMITVMSATAVEVREPGAASRQVCPEFATERQWKAWANDLQRRVGVPDSVDWSTLQSSVSSSAAPAGIPIGLGEAGVVTIDLIRSGPHALVGGTTGSGKSELLRVLALGWAAVGPPSAAQVLFVDFKGGATFAGLTELPHAVGLITDLDPIVAQRALRALRAELQDRERTLAEAGIRDIRDEPGLLPRLLVLVDEFATLAATFPELHGIFADLAARGRSLGVHLVLCTQHPASVVRDSVAANCPVRLSFRVTEATSAGIVGDRARELVSAPPGRAVLVDDRGSHVLQVAVVDDDDIAQVRDLWREHSRAERTWCEPLPARVVTRDLAGFDRFRGAEAVGTDVTDTDVTDTGVIGEQASNDVGIDEIAFGVLDDPDGRRRLRAVWSPSTEGCLAILGASSSGRTTVLATLAHGVPAHARAVILPASVPDAWAVLELLAARPPTATLLLCDRLDSLLARAGERASEVLARWDAAVQAVRSRGGAAAASLAAASAAGSLLSGRFESRLLLRCADADEHSLAGGPRGLFERSAPAGRGWWRDLQVQVAIGEQPLPAPEPVHVPVWRPDPDGDAVVIASTITELVERIARTPVRHRVVRDLAGVSPSTIDPATNDRGASLTLDPRLIIATPAEWQASWSVFSAARAHLPIVLVGVDQSEVRSVLGLRDALPPIDARQGECWLAEPGRPIVRARWHPTTDATRPP